MRNSYCSLRNRDRALLLQLRQVEQRCKGIERAEDQQLLQVETAVDQGDQIPFLRGKVESVEVREEFRRQLRNRAHALRMREVVADDGVADDLRGDAQ